jgi:hypothetical protein
MPPEEEQGLGQDQGAAPAAEVASADPTGGQPSEGSSQGQGDGGKPAEQTSVLEAVKSVIDAGRAAEAKQAAGAAAAAPGDGGQKQGAQAAATDGKPQDVPAKQGEARLSKEQWEALPAAFRQRVNQQEQTLRAQAPVVKAFTDMQTWARNNGLDQNSFSYGLQLVAAVRNDPARAYEMLKPVLADLRKHVGEELPEDLAADVSAGTISQERAQELARARNEKARLDEQARMRAEADVQAQQETAVQTLRNTQTQGIAAYENQWKASDPDYAKKAPLVWDRMAALMSQQGQPTTREAAVELLKQARQDVEDRMKGFIPAPKPKEGIPAGGASGQARQQPTTVLEAARLGLAAARAG